MTEKTPSDMLSAALADLRHEALGLADKIARADLKNGYEALLFWQGVNADLKRLRVLNDHIGDAGNRLISAADSSGKEAKTEEKK